MTKEKLAELVACHSLGPPGGIASSFEISHGLGRFVWDVDLGEITGPQKPCVLHCIAPVRLHPLAGLHRHQGGSHYHALDPRHRQITMQAVAGWARLVAALQAAKLPKPLHEHGRVVGDRRQNARLTPSGLRHCDGDAVRVDIQTDES